MANFHLNSRFVFLSIIFVAILLGGFGFYHNVLAVNPTSVTLSLSSSTPNPSLGNWVSINWQAVNTNLSASTPCVASANPASSLNPSFTIDTGTVSGNVKSGTGSAYIVNPGTIILTVTCKNLSGQPVAGNLTLNIPAPEISLQLISNIPDHPGWSSVYNSTPYNLPFQIYYNTPRYFTSCTTSMSPANAFLGWTTPAPLYNNSSFWPVTLKNTGVSTLTLTCNGPNLSKTATLTVTATQQPAKACSCSSTACDSTGHKTETCTGNYDCNQTTIRTCNYVSPYTGTWQTGPCQPNGTNATTCSTGNLADCDPATRPAFGCTPPPQPQSGTWQWSGNCAVISCNSNPPTGAENRICLPTGATCPNDNSANSRACTPACSNSTSAITIDGVTSGGTWAPNTTKTVRWTTGSFSSNVEIWLCTGTNPNTQCQNRLLYNLANDGSESVTIPSTATGNKYIFVRKNGDTYNTYTGNGFSGPFTVVPVGTPPTPPPATNAPSVNSVQVSNIYTDPTLNSWTVGDSKTVSWTYSNFGQYYINPNIGQTVNAQTALGVQVNSVSISLCNPTDNSKCVFFGNKNVGFEKTVPAGSGGSGNKSELIGATALQAIQNFPEFALAFNNFTTRVRVCPTITTIVSAYNYLIGTVPAGATCSYSPVFTVVAWGGGSSSTYNLSSGQGCVVGECVCVNGKAARCGQPMTSGGGCPATSWCPAGPSASLSGRLMASLGAFFSRFETYLFNW